MLAQGDHLSRRLAVRQRVRRVARRPGNLRGRKRMAGAWPSRLRGGAALQGEGEQHGWKQAENHLAGGAASDGENQDLSFHNLRELMFSGATWAWPRESLFQPTMRNSTGKRIMPHEEGGPGTRAGRPGIAGIPFERLARMVVSEPMNTVPIRARVRQLWQQEIRPLLTLMLVLFSLRSSLADWNDVPTGSMNPTIIEGDRVLVNKLAYDFKLPFTTWHLAEWANPERGDIVVFYSPHDGKRLVKRVIGLPGDTVEMRDEQILLNGQPVAYAPLAEGIAAQLPLAKSRSAVFATEQLAKRPHAVMALPGVQAKRSFGPERVAEGHYFMLGDNRDNSFDSRFWGSVPRQSILGRTTTVILSLDRDCGWLPRWNRSFTALDRCGD